MRLDPALLAFLEHQLVQFPRPRDPNNLAAHQQRFEAAAKALPGVHVPVAIGDFKLNLGGPQPRTLAARLYHPAGAQRPVLMAYFPGGGWAASGLDSHDLLCRQLCHDLGIALVSIRLPDALEGSFLQISDDAMRALITLLGGRAQLSVNTERLLVGGDGSGAHLALQAAWRLNRQSPGAVDAALAFYPLVKPDFNTLSYRQHASSLAFSRDDAVRAWHSLLRGRFETWDERAVLLHGNAPVQRPPAVLVLAAQCDGAHDDAVALHDWLRHQGARCEFLGAPGMPHDFVRLQHASAQARQLTLDALAVFADAAGLSATVPTSGSG